MISSILVIVVAVILFIFLSFNFIWLLVNALKEGNKYLLSIIVITLKYFGL